VVALIIDGCCVTSVVDGYCYWMKAMQGCTYCIIAEGDE
jgi:hypothetical protein